SRRSWPGANAASARPPLGRGHARTENRRGCERAAAYRGSALPALACASWLGRRCDRTDSGAEAADRDREAHRSGDRPPGRDRRARPREGTRSARRPDRASCALKALFQRGKGRRFEAHRRDECGNVLVLRGDHRARDVRPLRPKVAEQRLDQAAADALLARRGIDPEKLDPPGGLLETELTTADLAQHEADDAAADVGDLRRVGVAADVVRGALLPDLGAVLPGDAFVDAADAFDVELG